MGKLLRTLLITICGTLVGGILATFLAAYVSLEPPKLWFESGCDTSFGIDSPQIDFQIRNRENTEAFSSLCLYSEEVKFEIITPQEYVVPQYVIAPLEKHFTCSHKEKINPVYTNIATNFEVPLKFKKEEPPENITIELFFTCKAKVWRFFPKTCNDINKICYYKKEFYDYRLVEA